MSGSANNTYGNTWPTVGARIGLGSARLGSLANMASAKPLWIAAMVLGFIFWWPVG